MNHPTLMMRRSILEKEHLTYSSGFPHAEDFDFLQRAADCHPLANLPEVLLLYRVHEGQVSVANKQEQIEARDRLCVRQLRILMRDLTEEEEDFHIRLISGKLSACHRAQVEQWLLSLDRANRQSARYEPAAFQRELRRQWYYFHAQASLAGLGVLLSYWTSSWAGIRDIPLRDHAALVAKCLMRRSAWRQA